VSRVTFDVPSDVKDLMSRHKEMDWNGVVSNTLLGYARKIKLLDAVMSKSKLKDRDVERLDHEIKAGLAKKYPV
jgi:hypothetical protein